MPVRHTKTTNPIPVSNFLRHKVCNYKEWGVFGLFRVCVYQSIGRSILQPRLLHYVKLSCSSTSVRKTCSRGLFGSYLSVLHWVSHFSHVTPPYSSRSRETLLSPKSNLLCRQRNNKDKESTVKTHIAVTHQRGTASHILGLYTVLSALLTT